jgi:hypothetical protein
LIREDEWYGWAQKAESAERRYEVTTSRSLAALVTGELRRRRRRSATRG